MKHKPPRKRLVVERLEEIDVSTPETDALLAQIRRQLTKLKIPKKYRKYRLKDLLPRPLKPGEVTPDPTVLTYDELSKPA